MKQRALAHRGDRLDPPSTPTAPGRAPRTQRHVARLDAETRAAQHAVLDAAWSAPVQLARDSHSGLDDREVRAAAAHGLSSGGGPLPYLETIQRAFGPHDVTGVTAHVGGAAREASEALGARAYATGDHVAFAESPSLFLAAHEAAHVVQQRAGVHLSSAVGQAGDAYEQQADAVAARVVAGESAADLLGPVATRTGAAVQRDARPAAPPAASWSTRAIVPTDWFIDFWGVGKDHRRPGRGHRNVQDVLVLEDLRFGPKSKPFEIERAGNALGAGYSTVGHYPHPRGPGAVVAKASYARQRQLQVQLTWTGQKRGEKNPNAMAAARAAVEERILEHSEHSGDWDQVEYEAAEAAAAHLPEGADPVVTIAWKGNHERHALETVDYEVTDPSTCTINVRVPTSTTVTPWTVRNTETKRQTTHRDHVETGEEGVDVEVRRSRRTRDANQRVDVDRTITDDRTSRHTNTKTRIEREYGVTWERIEQASSSYADWITEHGQSMLRTLTGEFEQQEDGGKVEVEDDRGGFWDRTWDAIEDIGKDAVEAATDAAVDVAKGVLKVAKNKWIRKGLARSSPWAMVIGYGADYAIDWAGKKVKGRLQLDKTKDKEDGPRDADDGISIEQLALVDRWRTQMQSTSAATA